MQHGVGLLVHGKVELLGVAFWICRHFDLYTPWLCLLNDIIYEVAIALDL